MHKNAYNPGDRRLKELAEQGPDMTPEELLDKIDEIEPGHLRPSVGIEMKMDLHHHFVASQNPKTRGKQVKAFWAAVEKSELDAVAITTHSNIKFGVNPESIYHELNDAMPEHIKQRGFKLLAGMEVMCKGDKEGYDVELAIISPDPDRIYKNPYWYPKQIGDYPYIMDVAQHIHDDPKLLGFMPHAFLSKTGAAHEQGIGLEKAKRIIGELGIGVELSGIYRDGRIFTDLPAIKWLFGVGPLKRLRDEFRTVDDEVHTSGLASIAKFITVGGDYHHYKDLGRAGIVVIANGKSALPLRQQYKVTERESGLVVLETSTDAIEDVTKKGIKTEELLDSVKAGKPTSKPVLTEPEVGFKLLLQYSQLGWEMAQERVMQLKEKPLAEM